LSALIGVSVFNDLIDVEPFRQVSNDGGAAVALLGVAEQVLVEVRHPDKLQNEIRTIWKGKKKLLGDTNSFDRKLAQ
jgi:hypothetical protein